MTDIQFAILTGVISGILTTIIVWFCIQLFQKIFIPWYQNSVYKGINISGNWISKFNFRGGVEVEQTIELKQRGHKLIGTLTSRHKIPSVGNETVTFTLVGVIFDNYVDIEYQNNDKRFIGRGSMLLKVKDGGSKLDGSLVAIDRFSTEIMTSEVKWTRK